MNYAKLYFINRISHREFIFMVTSLPTFLLHTATHDDLNVSICVNERVSIKELADHIEVESNVKMIIEILLTTFTLIGKRLNYF